MTNIKSADVEAGIRKVAVECPPRGHKADMLLGRHDRLQVPGKAKTKNETPPVPALGARGKIGLRFFSQGAVMAQLLIVLLVPPVVGLVTYFIVRLSSKRDALVVAGGPPRRRKPGPGIFARARRRWKPSPGIFARARRRSHNLKPEPSSQDRTIILLALGIAGGFVFGWYLL